MGLTFSIGTLDGSWGNLHCIMLVPDGKNIAYPGCLKRAWRTGKGGSYQITLETIFDLIFTLRELASLEDSFPNVVNFKNLNFFFQTFCEERELHAGAVGIPNLMTSAT